MKLLRSFLATRSSGASTTLSPPLSDEDITYNDSPSAQPSSSSSSSSSTSSSVSDNSSIQSNLSLLTLPSVPSLQKLAPQYYTTASASSFSATTITTTLVTSLNQTSTQRHSKAVNFLALHNNLLYAATGDQVNVYEMIHSTPFDTFGCSKSKSSSTGSVKSVAFLDGKVFLSHQDCKITVWKLNDRDKKHKLVATLPTLEDRLFRFLLPQNYVNVRRHKKKLWIEHYDAVSGLAVSHIENRMVSVSWDGSIKIWEAQRNDFRCLESVNKAHDDAINAVVVSEDGTIYTGSADKKIKAWKRQDKCKKYELVATLEKHKSAVNALALSSDGSVLFSGSCDRSILVWEREDSANHMAVTGALRGHTKAIFCLINVHDLLMSGSADRTVRIWRRACDDGRYCCLAVLDGRMTPVRSLAAVAEEGGDGAVVKVFSGGFDGDVTVWRVEV